MTYTTADRHPRERGGLRWTLGVLWLCITAGVVVRLLTGSEGWGALGLLVAAIVACALLPSSRPRWG